MPCFKGPVLLNSIIKTAQTVKRFHYFGPDWCLIDRDITWRSCCADPEFQCPLPTVPRCVALGFSDVLPPATTFSDTIGSECQWLLNVFERRTNGFIQLCFEPLGKQWFLFSDPPPTYLRWTFLCMTFSPGILYMLIVFIRHQHALPNSFQCLFLVA